jgi:hypothetical protein
MSDEIQGGKQVDQVSVLRISSWNAGLGMGASR